MLKAHSEIFSMGLFNSFTGYESDISIKIESQLKDNKLSAQVKVISENDIVNNKLVVFLLEDGLLYDQVNYRNEDPRFPSYQMGIQLWILNTITFLECLLQIY